MTSTRRRRLWLVLALLAAVSLAAGTGSLSAAKLERGMSVEVADSPEEALVGVEVHNRTLEHGQHDDVALFTMTNRFDREVTVSAAVVTDDPQPPTLSNVSAPEELDSKNSGDVMADVVCSDADDDFEAVKVALTIEGEDGDIMVQLTRAVSVSCKNPS